MTQKRSRGVQLNAGGALTAGLVLVVVGVWMLTGDVELGLFTLTHSPFFGTVSLLAGLAFLVGGSMVLIRRKR